MNQPHQYRTDIKVKLLPRSSKNQIIGKEGDTFMAKVTSPPVDGLANKALIKMLAKRLGIPGRDIELISGKKSRMKSIRIYGLSQEEIMVNLDNSF